MKPWLLLLPAAVSLSLAMAQDIKPRRPLVSPAPGGAPRPSPAKPAAPSPAPAAETPAPSPTPEPPAQAATVTPAAPAAVSQAAPPAAVPSNAIPKAYAEEHYAATWRRNPFLIETKAKDAAPGPSFADDWELKGLTRIKGEPQAMLGNKKTQEYHWVKTTEDKDGFKLLEAKFDRDIHKQSVKVAKSGDPNPATFTFPEVAAAPAAAMGARVPGAPGAGAPGAIPRGPGVPPAASPANAFRPTVPNAQAGAQRPGMPMAAPGAQPTPNTRRRTLLPPQPVPAQPGN